MTTAEMQAILREREKVKELFLQYYVGTISFDEFRDLIIDFEDLDLDD